MILEFYDEWGDLGEVDCRSTFRCTCSFPHCNCPSTSFKPQTIVPLTKPDDEKGRGHG